MGLLAGKVAVLIPEEMPDGLGHDMESGSGMTVVDEIRGQFATLQTSTGHSRSLRSGMTKGAGRGMMVVDMTVGEILYVWSMMKIL